MSAKETKAIIASYRKLVSEHDRTSKAYYAANDEVPAAKQRLDRAKGARAEAAIETVRGHKVDLASAEQEVEDAERALAAAEDALVIATEAQQRVRLETDGL